MSTVVSRLHEVIATTPGPVGLARGVVLSITDAKALDAIIAELCPEHGACEACSEPLCERCAIGQHGCDHSRILCHSCAPGACRECADAIGDDQAAAIGGW